MSSSTTAGHPTEDEALASWAARRRKRKELREQSNGEGQSTKPLTGANLVALMQEGRPGAGGKPMPSWVTDDAHSEVSHSRSASSTSSVRSLGRGVHQLAAGFSQGSAATGEVGEARVRRKWGGADDASGRDVPQEAGCATGTGGPAGAAVEGGACRGSADKRPPVIISL
mmetsp:Transcript_80318/g.223347  ORF Transcript_80318/g.223347 Transcript_80318/m.223347 type:complete len:170 (-) Transcript_80318:168-677(-)